MRYYLVVIRGTFLKGVGLDVLWPQMAALAALGVALLGISVSAIPQVARLRRACFSLSVGAMRVARAPVSGRVFRQPGDGRRAGAMIRSVHLFAAALVGAALMSSAEAQTPASDAPALHSGARRHVPKRHVEPQADRRTTVQKSAGRNALVADARAGPLDRKPRQLRDKFLRSAVSRRGNLLRLSRSQRGWIRDTALPARRC